MAESYSVQAQLSAVDKNFSSAFENASNVAEKMGKTLSVVGAGTTAFGVMALKSFGNYEKALNQAAVTAGGTAKDIDGLSEVAKRVSATLPVSAQESAEAMIEMAQAGADVSKIKTYFPQIAKAAIASGSDVKVTASTVENAMTIWGDSLKKPERAAAILVDTANLSNASMADMSNALANVGGSASNMGMSMQDTATAIGLLTNHGFSAAQASQDLNHAILQMQAPSSKARDKMIELGLSFTDAQGNMKPFPNILKDVNTALDGLKPAERAAALKTLFGTAGMGAILPLLDSIKNETGNAAKSWDGMSSQIDKDSKDSATSTAFLENQTSEMQKNVGSSLTQINHKWQDLIMASMQGTKQISSGYLSLINSALAWAIQSNSAGAQAIRAFIGLSPVIGTVITTVGSLSSSLANVGKGFGMLKAFMTNPFTAGVVAIAALIAILAKAYQQSETFRNAISSVGNVFKSILGPSIDSISNGLKKMFGAFAGAGTSKGLIDTLATSIGNGLATAINSVPWETIFKGMAAIINVVIGIVHKLIDVWNGLPAPVQNAAEKMAKFAAAAVLIGLPLKIAGSLITSLIANMVGIGSGSAAASTSMSGMAKAAGSTGGAMSGLIGKIVGVVTSLGGVFSSGISSAGGLISLLGGKLVDMGGKTGIAGKAISLLGSAFSFISGPVGIVIAALTLVTAGVSLFGSNAQIVTSKIVAFGQAFQTAAPQIGQAFGSVISGLGTMILSAVPGVIAGMTSLMTALTTTVVSLAPIVVMGFSQMFLAISQAILSATPTIILGLTNLLVAFTAIIVSMAPQVVASFVAILTAFTTAVVSAMPQIVQDGVDLIVSLLNGIAQAIPQIVPAAINVIVTFLTTLTQQMPQLITAGIQFIVSVLQGIAQNMPQLITSAVQVIVTFLTGLTQHMPELITAGVQFIVSILNGIAANIGDLITAGTRAIVNFLEGIASNLGNVISAGVDVVVSFIEGIANNLGKVINAAVDLIGKFLQGLASAIPRITDQAVAAVMKFVYGVGYTLGRVTSSGTELISQFAKGIMAGMGMSSNSARNVANGALNAIKGFVSSFGSVGRNIASGVARGIAAGASSVISAAANIAKSALNAAKSALGIHSPSRVMKKQVGFFISEGMALGITDNISAVENASDTLAQAAIPDINTKDMVPSFNTADLSDSIASANASIDHQFNTAASAELTVNQQPANINLNLGNQNYRAFVNDISKQQDQNTDLELRY
ncbi:phage tail tape measure protein [Fructilactobacillus frigidiflavus]|uniref:phage tail tape measure protein n=1 Tax=Fructilactobacillus frigidiflavus TaxID=3242688 RepID=UPI003757FDFC